MTEELYGLGAQLGVVAVLGAIGAAALPGRFRPTWFLLALALYALNDALLTRGFFTLPEVLPDARWNWFGKGLALAGTLVIASLPVFGWRRIGLRWGQGERPLFAYGVFALLSSLFVYLAISASDGRDNRETIAFQWTMPGLEEEPFYRGVLLLAMNEAFEKRVRILGAPIGYGGLLTSVLFGLAHALDYEKAAFQFDALTFAMTGVPSLLLLWLRERTGSLVLPIVAHNVANGAGTIF